jgi:hypothetical protein
MSYTFKVCTYCRAKRRLPQSRICMTCGAGMRGNFFARWEDATPAEVQQEQERKARLEATLQSLIAEKCPD